MESEVSVRALILAGGDRPDPALLDAGRGLGVSELFRWVEQRTRTEIAPDEKAAG